MFETKLSRNILFYSVCGTVIYLILIAFGITIEGSILGGLIIATLTTVVIISVLLFVIGMVELGIWANKGK